MFTVFPVCYCYQLLISGKVCLACTTQLHYRPLQSAAMCITLPLFVVLVEREIQGKWEPAKQNITPFDTSDENLHRVPSIFTIL